MPPTSRGSLLFSIIRRSASTSTSYKPTPRTHATRVPSKSKPSPQTVRSSLNERRSGSEKTNVLDPTSSASQSSRQRFFHHILRHPLYRYLIRAVLIAPALVLAILHSPYEVMTVNGQSMSPFLNPKSPDGLSTTDHILVERWRSSAKNNEVKLREEAGAGDEYNTEFQRGQIVIFPTPHRPERIAVKRVVAIPGDVVQPLPGYAGGDGPVVVPWNHLWVEGDVGRRAESMDSNWYGPISQNLVLGEVKAARSSWWKWNWIDWRKHSWPAREEVRVEENAVQEAAVDPDAVVYNSGWSNGSIALILERMRQQPDQALYKFVNDPAIRQETRRLYNNALYVADIATSPHEKALAKEVTGEMEDLYGREALIFGIRMRQQTRKRGALPNARISKADEAVVKDQAASDAEKWLKKQGWELERNHDGTVNTQAGARRTTTP